jgi:hypothetical protein
MALRYDVRILGRDGKLITKKRFALKDAAVRFVADKLKNRRKARIDTVTVATLKTFQNTAWGPSPHDPWVRGPQPVSELFFHHTVTKQLPVTASLEAEREQMRLLDQIAHSRGFNGISYCWVCFPSGRCWEGRGWGIVEAATEGHNTSGDSLVFAGNYSAFKLSEQQKQAAVALVNRAQVSGFLAAKGLNIRGHREVDSTSCPGDKITSAWIESVQAKVNGG